MNLKNFTAPQREAMLDLALLAMYADGHLASAEDERVHRLLTAMGAETEHDRGRQYDAAVARVRRPAVTADAARDHAAKLAGAFATADERRNVLAVLDELAASDSQVAAQERGYLATVREAFGM